MKFLSHREDMPGSPFPEGRAERGRAVCPHLNCLEIGLLNAKIPGPGLGFACMMRSAAGNWGHSERGRGFVYPARLNNR
jgi:hypothetical protein